jgi:hypothetical protein
MFMDQNECETVIPAARGNAGLTSNQLTEKLNQAASTFRENTRRKFSRDSQW